MTSSPVVLVVSKKIDCRWMYDPLPIFYLQDTLAQSRSGEIIEMLSNDPGSHLDMQAWSKMTGHAVLEVQYYDDYHRFLIQKKS